MLSVHLRKGEKIGCTQPVLAVHMPVPSCIHWLKVPKLADLNRVPTCKRCLSDIHMPRQWNSVEHYSPCFSKIANTPGRVNTAIACRLTLKTSATPFREPKIQLETHNGAQYSSLFNQKNDRFNEYMRTLPTLPTLHILGTPHIFRL